MNREAIKDAARCSAIHYTVNDEQFDEHVFAFMEGAQWRINSVWQDATKFKPRHGSKVAVLVGGKDITVWNFENGMEQAFSCMSIKCWAYLDDLIPDRKED